MRELKTENMIFKNTCVLVLDGLLDDRTIKNFLKDPEEINWDDPSLQKKLQERLASSYGIYLERVSGMLETLEEAKTRLGLNETGSVEWIDRSFIKRAWKSGKLSLRRSSYDEIISKLQGHNRELQELTNQTAMLHQSRQKKGNTYVKKLKNLRDCAKSIYHTLRLRSMSCSCQNAHSASIELRPQRFRSQSSFSMTKSELDVSNLTTSHIVTRESSDGKKIPLSIEIQTQNTTEKLEKHSPVQPGKSEISSKGIKSVKWKTNDNTPVTGNTTILQTYCQMFKAGYTPQSLPQYIGSIVEHPLKYDLFVTDRETANRWSDKKSLRDMIKSHAIGFNITHSI
jgi:hypothetical protein